MANPEHEKDRMLEILETRLAAAWEEGSPVAGYSPEDRQKTAAIALRRWKSSARRGISNDDIPAKIHDLAKGLIEAFEPDLKLVGPLKRDYEWLAQELAAILRSAS